MEVLPGVHAVRLLGSTAFAILEDEITLVDAGLRGSKPILERYLARFGRSLAEIRRIVCTHYHPDHTGGVRELVRGPDVLVLMHPADTERLRISLREAFLRRLSPSAVLALITRGPEDAQPIADGDVLPALGGLEVVHAPGHTPGTVCLYAPRHRALFVGDALQVIRGQLSGPSQLFTDDMRQARRSIAKLAEREVDTILFAHYPPWRSGAREALRALAGTA